ncbi:MAG: PKD domain-containing protein [Pedobacter sp.]|jgi:gliding motility-associated-like protein
MNELGRFFRIFVTGYITNLRYIAVFFLLFASVFTAFAQPANNECVNAIEIADAREYCSGNGQYSNINASPSFTGTGNDVWFKFTARNFEVKVTVSGFPGTGTLQLPEIRLYNSCDGSLRTIETIKDGNTTIITGAGLVPGITYYIGVSGANNNTGTFKLCIENYQSEIKAGQDFSGASLICSIESIIREVNISGAGLNPNEAIGTCLDVLPGVAFSETNSAWYKWTAANDGTLVFTITPSKRDDIDWVLYELGPEGNTQNPMASNTIRCAAGEGINQRCANEATYVQTGLDFNATDQREASGCGTGQDGVVQFITMKKGYVYALLVNNASAGNNGFEIAFTDKTGKAGTGLFKGPSAKIKKVDNNLCTSSPSYTFSSEASDFTILQWYFGEGASIAGSTNQNPGTVTYNTSGLKTVVLQVKNNDGCSIVQTETFIHVVKPDLPKISGLQSRYCVGEIINLKVDLVDGASYSWTGPEGFSASTAEIKVPVDGSGKAGIYAVTVSLNGCTSDPASVSIASIGQTPTAAFIVTNNNPCTVQQSFTFTNSSKDFQKIRWDFGAGSNIPPGGSNPVNTITYSSSGTKTIRLEAEGSSGCISVFTQEIIVALSPVKPVIIVNKPDFCLTDVIRLSTAAQSDVTYNWTGPNNFSSNLQSPEIPVTSEAVAGTYSLTLSRGNCSTGTVSIVVPPIYKNPVAAFRSEPRPPSKLSFPIRVRFFNESKDADAFLWDFGDGNTSTDKDPEHTYLSAGDFDVTLTVFKSSVCSASTAQGQFMISPNNILFIPNTFTPNNDALNDEFVVSMTNIKTYRIQIFNRFGVSMFVSDDLFNHWKGTFRNEPLPVGTYYYKIDASDFNDTVIKRSGPVTILR